MFAGDVDTIGPEAFAYCTALTDVRFLGTGYEIGACALVRGGPRDEQANARRFIDWMTSPRGQECYIEAKSCRLPANSMARAADGLPALADMNLIAYDLEWAGQNRARLVDTLVRQVRGAGTPSGRRAGSSSQ